MEKETVRAIVSGHFYRNPTSTTAEIPICEGKVWVVKLDPHLMASSVLWQKLRSFISSVVSSLKTYLNDSNARIDRASNSANAYIFGGEITDIPGR
jgi:hypothetical protein